MLVGDCVEETGIDDRDWIEYCISGAFHSGMIFLS